jgi:hypothetical protein
MVDKHKYEYCSATEFMLRANAFGHDAKGLQRFGFKSTPSITLHGVTLLDSILYDLNDSNSRLYRKYHEIESSRNKDEKGKKQLIRTRCFDYNLGTIEVIVSEQDVFGIEDWPSRSVINFFPTNRKRAPFYHSVVLRDVVTDFLKYIQSKGIEPLIERTGHFFETEKRHKWFFKGFWSPDVWKEKEIK